MELEDVKQKIRRKNQILFSRESASLQELLQLIRQQKHRTLVMWALACAEEPARILNKRHPDHKEPEQAILLCKEWAKGKIKMPEAKRALLKVHALAKKLADPADIALCHAVGQACATVHVETHTIGLPIYELTAIVRSLGWENCETAVKGKIAYYMERLQVYEKLVSSVAFEWADFLMDDSRPNQEQLLADKKQRTQP